MKKRILFGFFIFIILINLAFLQAQTTLTNETAKVNSAYSCLNSKIDGKCSSLSTEEKIFSVLATGKCSTELRAASSNNGECWSGTGSACNMKTTAQAILAFDKTNQQTTAARDWLISRNISTTELNWYLQVDSDDVATCTVNYGSSSYEFSIDDEKRLSVDAGSCLIRTPEGYWFTVSPNCYSQEFQVSCNQNFKTNLLFSKTTSSTIHVSSETHGASPGGITTEKVESFCFAENNVCNYEGTLWAALALDSVEKPISSYLPYLITLADEESNARFIPDSFLFILTNDLTYRTSLLAKQKSSKWWSESGDRYYDTALALYPFVGQNLTEKTNAKQWLLESQDANGCWQDNTRNTAFILASVWPRTSSSGGTGGLPTCPTQYSCVSSSACTGAGGQSLSSQYSCSGFSVCCTVSPPQPTCSDLGGTLCSASQTICRGGLTSSASDATGGQTCCVGGTCQTPIIPVQSQCAQNNGTCRQSSCFTEEEQGQFSCDSVGQVCCFEETKGSNYLWIWILLGLIVLVLIGIIFRDKLRDAWFKMKPKSSGAGPGFRGPPHYPPRYPPHTPYHPGQMRPFPERRILMPQQPRPMPSPARSPASRELDDVLKKLKEMGK